MKCNIRGSAQTSLTALGFCPNWTICTTNVELQGKNIFMLHLQTVLLLYLRTRF